VPTDDADLGNLQGGLAAREINPKLRIVMRMFSADLADRATRLLVLRASQQQAVQRA
jgi:hypothetical protein